MPCGPSRLYMDMYFGSPLNTFVAASMNPSHRHRIRIAVTAYEVILRMPAPLSGGSWQVLVEERRIVQDVAGHGVILQCCWCVTCRWNCGDGGIVTLKGVVVEWDRRD